MDSILNILLVSTILGLSYGQLIIPHRPLGYIYSGTRDAPVHLDVHMGPLCPDSAAAFETLKAVATHYGPTNFVLVLHMFPLPYHQQAFLVAKGAQIVKRYGSGPGGEADAYMWFKHFYNHLSIYSNSVTADKTTDEVVAMLADIALTLGVSNTTFMNAMHSTEIEVDTRAAWTYSCTRGVASTPTFFLNDIIVEAQSTWTLNDWEQAIDPLMVGLPRNTQTCPVGTVKCEYLPGKTECCTQGESCIPNVGCRCMNAAKCIIV
ncbi:hypothetical protein ACF0H5_017165 [Mactra antiquata]